MHPTVAYDANAKRCEKKKKKRSHVHATITLRHGGAPQAVPRHRPFPECKIHRAGLLQLQKLPEQGWIMAVVKCKGSSWYPDCLLPCYTFGDQRKHDVHATLRPGNSHHAGAYGCRTQRLHMRPPAQKKTQDMALNGQSYHTSSVCGKPVLLHDHPKSLLHSNEHHALFTGDIQTSF